MGLFGFEEIEVTDAWGTLQEGLRNLVLIKECVGCKCNVNMVSVKRNFTLSSKTI